MKVTDLTEALETAAKLYKKKYKKDAEIFDLEFNNDEYEGALTVDLCSKVKYESDSFPSGTKRGMKPLAIAVITFECVDRAIDDRSVRLEDG